MKNIEITFCAAVLLLAGCAQRDAIGRLKAPEGQHPAVDWSKPYIVVEPQTASPLS